MFVHTLLGVCVCVALCVSQNADSASDAEQQDRITRKQAYVHVNNRLGVFIAAAVGTMTLMGVIYCIYNQFYTKHPYTHTQLQET
ncbi:sodium-dependent neutral amino acid transporter B(0)AT2-like, partial [Clarias magur]